MNFYLHHHVKRHIMMSNEFFETFIFENASFNRPPDTIRVEDIYTNYKDKQTYVDGIIHFYTSGEKLYCYDGIHRLITAEKLYKEGIHKMMTIDILYSSETIALHHFQQINNRVEVPNVVITTKTNDIYGIVDEFFKDKFKLHLSPSPRCKKPNICRDVFVERIKHLEGDILSELHKRNSKCAEYVKQNRTYLKKLKCTPKQLEKCDETGLYLFLFDDWLNPPISV